MSEIQSKANGGRKQMGPKLDAEEFSTKDSGSFTQIFDALKKQDGAPRQRNDSESNGRFDNAGMPNALHADEEGFTQIFERVKGGKQIAPSRDEAARFPANDSQVPPALNQQRSESEFTRLLRKVSLKPNVVKTSGPAPTPNTVLRADSPGEFTRVVSQSMRREARGQSHNKGLPETHESTAAPPNKSEVPQDRPLSAGQSRIGFPESVERLQPRPNSEQASAAMPINPQAMLYTAQEAARMAGGGAPSLSRAAEQVAHTASSRSSGMRTASASRPTVESKLQEYVPLLMIANLFLTVLLLLLVGFALLHKP